MRSSKLALALLGTSAFLLLFFLIVFIYEYPSNKKENNS